MPVAIAALAVALLAGCTPAPQPTETDLSGPNPGVDPTGEPAPTLTAQPTGTPVTQSCDDLVSPDTIYAYNPNFGLLSDYEPRAGSAGESALKYSGVACRWQNQTSGENIDVSVAQLDDATLTALKNSAFEDSAMVPTYGEEAYFTVTDGVGIAQVFQGEYWIIAESPTFFEPGDATEIVDSVIAALG